MTFMKLWYFLIVVTNGLSLMMPDKANLPLPVHLLFCVSAAFFLGHHLAYRRFNKQKIKPIPVAKRKRNCSCLVKLYTNEFCLDLISRICYNKRINRMLSMNTQGYKMNEYKVILENGLYLLLGGMSFSQWVARMMAWTSQWPSGLFNFTDLNEAHRVEDRAATIIEMQKLIARCDEIEV